MQTHWEKHANAVKTRAAGELPPVIEKKWVRMAEFYLRKRTLVIGWCQFDPASTPADHGAEMGSGARS